MGFTSFVGRVLFVSVFIVSAWQEFNEFGVDGGTAAKAFEPKYNVFTKHVTSYTGVEVPDVEIKHLVAAAIALKGIGGILFIFGSSFGAYLLLIHLAFTTPILYDFYNYDIEKPQCVQLFIKFTQNLALFGALLFFLGMKNSVPRRQPKKKAPKTKMG
ncbi:HR-like lesion-inducer [Macleaya cordata]|uniref:HR-like lesion-inducer n=1 Tax=Macleaya cordata TaxID=56857 RepID=A0A200PW46_MACCD|nr:HR-like lesion-inducer [Macleaya cordata]